MQYISSCPICKTQNARGHKFCGNCGAEMTRQKKLRQIYCPNCDSVCTINQQFCGNFGSGLFIRGQQNKESAIHILALDPVTRLIRGFKTRDSSLILLPCITEDGHLSTLSAGGKREFQELQKTITNRIQCIFDAYKTFLCVGAIIVIKNNPLKTAMVCDVIGSTIPVSQMKTFYDLLAGPTEVGDEHWIEIEKLFNTEPRKYWINALITHLKQELNWNEYVKQSITILQTK